MATKVRLYIRLIRPHHYMKNIFVCLPLLFSGRVAERALVYNVLYGFAAFCLVCSAVYIYNDIMDAANDRQHSVKRMRPIASGAIEVKHALALSLALLVLSFLCQYTASSGEPLTWVYLYVYLLMNLAYSWRLKRVPILDVAILASGFLLRLLYGAALTGITVSGWLFLTVLAMSFYMGLGKRRGELTHQQGTRQVLKSYSPAFLEKSMSMCLTLTIAFYSLWAAEAGGSLFGDAPRSSGMLWTVPLAIVICLKYSMSLEGDSDGDPVEVVLRDKFLCAMVLLLGVMIVVLKYMI